MPKVKETPEEAEARKKKEFEAALAKLPGALERVGCLSHEKCRHWLLIGHVRELACLLSHEKRPPSTIEMSPQAIDQREYYEKCRFRSKRH
jgi:hypothetical protein